MLIEHVGDARDRRTEGTLAEHGEDLERGWSGAARSRLGMICNFVPCSVSSSKSLMRCPLILYHSLNRSGRINVMCWKSLREHRQNAALIVA